MVIALIFGAVFPWMYGPVLPHRRRKKKNSLRTGSEKQAYCIMPGVHPGLKLTLAPFLRSILHVRRLSGSRGSVPHRRFSPLCFYPALGLVAYSTAHTLPPLSLKDCGRSESHLR